LDAQLKKGLVDFCVLAALKNGESYGYKIVGDLLPCLSLSESTLYPVLRRLESRGEVTSREEICAGRVRRYYALASETISTIQKITEFIQSGGKQ